MKIKFLILLLNHCLFAYSQDTKNANNLNLYLNKNEKLIESLTVNKDTSGLSVGIYINGFESKKKRDKYISNYRKNKNYKNGSELPSLSINFISLTKPEKLNSLNRINYISCATFIQKKIKTTNPTYIIYKQKDGTYLRWTTNEVSIE